MLVLEGRAGIGDPDKDVLEVWGVCIALIAHNRCAITGFNTDLSNLLDSHAAHHCPIARPFELIANISTMFALV